MKKLTIEDFIKKAKNVHGDKYDYSLIDYKNAHSSVKIICPLHGIFKQGSNNHLNGHGCQKCTGNKKLNTEEFIQKSQVIHGNKYDYSEIRYINSNAKVKIICPIHGAFEQRPTSHLRGHGCPECNAGGKLNSFSKHIKILSEIGVEARQNGLKLEVKCYNCGKWHVQGLQSFWNKVNAANGKLRGENNFYCSDKCKYDCPVFGHKSNYLDHRSIAYIEKYDSKLARRCQTKSLKELQCDSHGYNYCEKCGDIIDVELHHTLEINKFNNDAINSSGHILLCAGCHLDIHRNCTSK